MSHNTSGRDKFAALVDDAISFSELTEQELAARLGYPNANVIKLFRKGITRVPLDKVVPIARLLQIDPGDLMREWYRAYYPAGLIDIEEQIAPLLTADEKSWIGGLRRHLGQIPPFDDTWGVAIKTVVQEAEL